MSKKSHAILAFVLLLSLMLTISGPAGAQEMTAEDTLGGDATGVVYEKKDSLFNGEPITLTIWDWHTPRVVLWEKLTPLYTELYPNVTFEITQIPGEDYWTKAIAAIPAGQGPDIYHFHNSNHTQFIENNLMEPFPEDLFDPAYYEENYLGFKEKHFHDAEGRIRYLPYGSMAALIYINTRLWEEAGLTEADYPATWDEMIEVAKKLTKYDSAGNIDVSGFVFNGYIPYLWSDMMYQAGRYHFTADGKGCQIDSPESRKALETVVRFYDENINSRDFLNWLEAFGTEKAAMTWAWTWFSGYMRETYPDIDFFTVNMPSFTGENLPSLGRQNYEVSLVVASNKPAERQAVAWDFMHWLYSQDEVLVDLALAHNIAPSYTKLFEHPRILADPTIATLAPTIEYKVFPGEFPTPFDTVLNQYIDQNIVAGVPIDELIPQAQEACNLAMQERDYWEIEHSYLHADAMIPDQP